MEYARPKYGLWLAAVLTFCMTAHGTAAQEPTHAADADAAAQFARVGVVPLRDDGNIRDGAQQLTEMLAGRLDGRFEEVEFIIVDPAVIGLKCGPVLLEEAVELGSEYEVEALLDGVFCGVEIVGGTWPNLGSDLPLARGVMRWRLVECAEGMLVIDGEIAPRKPQFYPKRIRTEEELINRVMQDLVAKVGDDLEAGGILAGTEQPAEEANGGGESSQEE
jgi:hypothetical protein